MTFTIVNQTLKKYEGNDTQIRIPDGITAIDDYAFYSARSLRSIEIPDTVREIGSNVFYDCESLESMVIPDSVTFLGSGLFSRCRNLRKAVLPSSLRSLPNITFYQCENLQEAVLPDQLRRIGRAAFQQCFSLASITLPSSLKILEDNVFDDCRSLREAVLPEGLEEIGNNVFYQCESLRTLKLPSSLKKIGKGAFETRGRLSIAGTGDLRLRSMMFDNNWNMYWNFGSNGRYNGKNEDNYQLYASWLPNVDLKEWKPEAQCILSINYMETHYESIPFYDEWIALNTETFLEKATELKRYEALNNAVESGIIDASLLEKYLDRIHDPKERALLLEFVRSRTDDLDDLFDMLGGDL